MTNDTIPSTIERHHANFCVHYGGTAGSPTCRAGVQFDEAANVKELGSFGYGRRLPCIRRNHNESHRHGQPLGTCPKLQWPTAEQCRAYERDRTADMERIGKALLAVKPIRERFKGKAWSGSIECPVCHGRLGVTHHQNGHVWARCQTHGCVAWME